MKVRLGRRSSLLNDISVVIVGAGFGGLAAAIELTRAGVSDITIFERGSDVGGVWRDNIYPGAACDVPSPIYSFSYALKPDWSALFGTQTEIQHYLSSVADDFGLRSKIRFNSEVTTAELDEADGTWTVTTAAGDNVTADALIMATGQLSRPKIPDVAGLGTFDGESFHSARWRDDIDLTGKRIVVVGSGASAIQVVPAIADQVAELTVVQRSPNWVMWKSRRVAGRLQTALMHRFGVLRRLHYVALFIAYELRYPLVTRAAKPVRRLAQWYLLRRLRRHVTDPAEVAAATPDYEVMCNRILLSNDWYRTIGRQHVHLVGSAVQRVHKHGVQTVDGRSIDADVIIWCTGFKAAQLLMPIAIRGRDGIDLHEQWTDGAEAYLGIAVPNFPNMFLLYGPNTNSITNTVIFLLERQATYIRKALQYRQTHRLAMLEVNQAAYDDFQSWLRRKLDKTVFTTGCPGWYTNEAGKVTAMWPSSHLSYAWATRGIQPKTYAGSDRVRCSAST